VRKGLRSILAEEDDLRVVAEAGDGLQVVRLCEQMRPNILILALRLPGLNGLDVARQVRRLSPQTAIVILTMYADEPEVLKALKYGVMGYVLKDADTGELLFAIRQAAQNRRYLSASISEQLIDSYLQQAHTLETDEYEQLSDREREVLHLVAEGLTNAEVANRLSIGARTVETHRANMMHKLHLKTQVDLIRYALQKGLIA
jgi:DNA-binding NarL/FixJ family response regulator